MVSGSVEAPVRGTRSREVPLTRARYYCAEPGCGRGFGDPALCVQGFLVWAASVQDHLRQMHGLNVLVPPKFGYLVAPEDRGRPTINAFLRTEYE